MKQNLRFGIRDLVLIVSVASLKIASLVYWTLWFESFYFSFTLASILFALIRSVSLGGRARAFWLAFAVGEICYLGIAHIPDQLGNSPRR